VLARTAAAAGGTTDGGPIDRNKLTLLCFVCDQEPAHALRLRNKTPGPTVCPVMSAAVAESPTLFGGGGGAVMLTRVARTATPDGRLVFSRFLAAMRERLQSSAEQRKVRRAFEQLSRTVGVSLLAAGSADEFRAAIDDALSKKELFLVLSEAAKLATFQAVEAASKSDVPPEVIEVLGTDAAATFQRGVVSAAVGASEGLRFLVRHVGGQAELERLMQGAAAALSDGDPMAFVHDHSIPLAVREAMLEYTSTLPVLFAFGRAMSLRKPLKPWLAQALAETFARGQRAYLGLIAAMPGTAVPEGLLPRAERLDIALIEREHAEYERRYQAALEDARAPQQGVHPV
jgi:hypothetical protein